MEKEQRNLLIIVIGAVALLCVMMSALWYIVWTAQEVGDVAAASAPSTENGNTVNGPPQTAASAGGSATGIVNGLQFEAVLVYEDAWPLLKAHNQFNDPPQDNNRMFMIKLIISNVESSLQNLPDIEESDFQLLGQDNHLYNTFDEESRCGVVSDAIGGVIPPGDWISGNVCFQIPEDEIGRILIYQPFIGDNALLQLDLANVARTAAFE